MIIIFQPARTKAGKSGPWKESKKRAMSTPWSLAWSACTSMRAAFMKSCTAKGGKGSGEGGSRRAWSH